MEGGKEERKKSCDSGMNGGREERKRKKYVECRELQVHTYIHTYVCTYVHTNLE